MSDSQQLSQEDRSGENNPMFLGGRTGENNPMFGKSPTNAFHRRGGANHPMFGKVPANAFPHSVEGVEPIIQGMVKLQLMP
jgi:hypothetical protein